MATDQGGPGACQLAILFVSVLNWRQASKGHEAVVEEAVVEEAVVEEAVEPPPGPPEPPPGPSEPYT